MKRNEILISFNFVQSGKSLLLSTWNETLNEGKKIDEHFIEFDSVLLI